jgi:hypothetical protein
VGGAGITQPHRELEVRKNMGRGVWSGSQFHAIDSSVVRKLRFTQPELKNNNSVHRPAESRDDTAGIPCRWQRVGKG